MYRFTQCSFQQDCQATFDRILEATLTLNNEQNVYPDINDVEEMYVNQLEKAASKDTSANVNTIPTYSNTYGEITAEVQEVLKGIKRNKAAGPD